jgi:hypothetical protein
LLIALPVAVVGCVCEAERGSGWITSVASCWRAPLTGDPPCGGRCAQTTRAVALQVAALLQSAHIFHPVGTGGAERVIKDDAKDLFALTDTPHSFGKKSAEQQASSSGGRDSCYVRLPATRPA